MPQIFPQWANKLPLISLGVVLCGLIAAVGGFWYYGSPRYLDVGYRPKQPVEYSHKLHAGDLGMDCRYCHTSVERATHANVPPTQTCMNCHKLVKPESEKLTLVRESAASHVPLQWVRVNNMPGYVYFEHASHINAGVACISCHGNVAQMEVVSQAQPLSMGWCLDCHRNPAPNLRPVAEVTNMKWNPPVDQADWAAQTVKARNIKPPTDCWGCHR